jgi:hypothetical protein
MEAEGGTHRINWLFAIMYNNLGKWGTVAVWQGVGVACIVVAVRQLLAKRA